jgi:hypothetical protein
MTSVTTSSGVLSRPHSSKPAFLNVLLVTGADDVPLIFMDVSTDGIRDDSPHLDEFIIHAALDAIESRLVSSPSVAVSYILGLLQ